MLDGARVFTKIHAKNDVVRSDRDNERERVSGRPLRLMVYDRTCVKRGIGLSSAWSAGAILYRGLGRFDRSFGASSWQEALEWLATFEASRPIEQIQYWGHGRWGRVLVGSDVLDAAALRGDHPLHPQLRAIRERIVPNGRSLLWLRTCEAFGARAGIDFAQALADFFGANVAGHTFIIGALQSGLHGLAPGCRPAWSPSEGLAEGTPERPERALWSRPEHPRTITCLSNAVPRAWLEEDSARAVTSTSNQT